MRNKEIRKITFAALLVAIAAFLKINGIQVTDSMRISFFAVPLLISGYFLGPIYGLMVGFATDTVYMFMSPYANIWSLYTIPTMLWGFAGWCIHLLPYKKNIISFIIVISITTVLETSINTLANYIRQMDIMATLFPRLITMVIRLPILIIITKYMVDRIKALELSNSY